MKASGRYGVVAAGHGVTADAAAEILSDGGNAFDAVIAGLCAACVPEVVLASPGGGGMMMAYVAERRQTLLYDFFVDTPLRKRPRDEEDFHSITVDFGPQTQEFHIGLGATATPGLVPGLFAIHQDLARLPMKRLVEPGVRAARHGVVQNAYQAYLFSIIPDILSGDGKAARCFAPNGEMLATGETLRNPYLAETWEWLAEDGARLFVDGPIGQEIVRQSDEGGGHLTGQDLRDYKVQVRTPLTRPFLGATVDLNPAPAASGPLIAFALELLAAVPVRERHSALALADVMARSNRLREKIWDTPGVSIDAILLQQIAEMRKHPLAPRGTTHITAVDKAGNVAAATVSNGEGNGVMVGNHGFMLNNMLGEEDLNPRGFHVWPCCQRMSTMMAPTVMRTNDGTVYGLGSGGSNRIRSAVLQVIANLVDLGLDAEHAVRAARLHVEKCGKVSFEAQLAPGDQAALLQIFPDAKVWPEPSMFFGGVHVAARHRDGLFEGVSDTRRAGEARIV